MSWQRGRCCFCCLSLNTSALRFRSCRGLSAPWGLPSKARRCRSFCRPAFRFTCSSPSATSSTFTAASGGRAQSCQIPLFVSFFPSLLSGPIGRSGPAAAAVRHAEALFMDPGQKRTDSLFVGRFPKAGRRRPPGRGDGRRCSPRRRTIRLPSCGRLPLAFLCRFTATLPPHSDMAAGCAEVMGSSAHTKLPHPVLFTLHSGVLAALAHFRCQPGSATTCIFLWGQPPRYSAQILKRPDCLRRQRPVAWRRPDFRCLGAFKRPVPGHRRRDGGLAQARPHRAAPARWRKLCALWQIAFTFVLATLAWVFFKSGSLSGALDVLSGMAIPRPAPVWRCFPDGASWPPL